MSENVMKITYFVSVMGEVSQRSFKKIIAIKNIVDINKSNFCRKARLPWICSTCGKRWANIFLSSMEHIGHVVRMTVSGYRGWWIESGLQHVVSFGKILYPHCSIRLRFEKSTTWRQPREGYSLLWPFRRNSHKNQDFLMTMSNILIIMHK